MSTLRAKTLARLREQIRTLEKPSLADRSALGFGDAAIDDELPGGGLASGCLHELIAAPQDGAAYGLVAALLARLIGDAGLALWCRLSQSGRPRSGRPAVPYGPGLVRFGLATRRLIFVRAHKPADLLWAMEEALRAGRFAAVLGEGLAPDLTATRRLQLAAEAGGSTALLVFPGSDNRNRLSAATTRWRIAALPAARPECPRWLVSLERCRGGGRSAWSFEWDHEALRLRVSAALADGSLAAASS